MVGSTFVVAGVAAFAAVACGGRGGGGGRRDARRETSPIEVLARVDGLLSSATRLLSWLAFLCDDDPEVGGTDAPTAAAAADFVDVVAVVAVVVVLEVVGMAMIATVVVAVTVGAATGRGGEGADTLERFMPAALEANVPLADTTSLVPTFALGNTTTGTVANTTLGAPAAAEAETGADGVTTNSSCDESTILARGLIDAVLVVVVVVVVLVVVSVPLVKHHARKLKSLLMK